MCPPCSPTIHPHPSGAGLCSSTFHTARLLHSLHPRAPVASLTVFAFLSSYTPPAIPAIPCGVSIATAVPSLSHPPRHLPHTRPRCRKAGLILSQLGDLSSWCNGLLQEPKISLQRSSLKYLACRYSEIKPYGLDWSELSRDLKKTCEEQTLSVLYNDYGDKDY